MRGHTHAYFYKNLTQSFAPRITGDSEVNSGSPLNVIAAREITRNGNETLFFNVDKENTSFQIPGIVYEKTIAMYLSR
jgi:hypothetical protein